MLLFDALETETGTQFIIPEIGIWSLSPLNAHNETRTFLFVKHIFVT